MIAVDPRTVVVVICVITSLLSLVFFSLTRKFPSGIQGLREWSLSMLVASVGSLLVALRGTLPDFFTVPLGPSLLCLGLYLGYLGSQRFFGLTPHIKTWLLVLTGVMLGMTWFTFVTPSFRVRLGLFGSLMMVLFVIHAAVLLRQRPATFATLLTGGALAASALIQIVRLALSFATQDSNNLLTPSPLNVIYVGTFVFMIILICVGILLLITDRLHTEMEHLATRDPLTNALTRRQLNAVCTAELVRCNRSQNSLALLMLDIDHFKAINDTFGHQAGDRVLVHFVAMINALLRKVDSVGRFGGEEFVVLLPDSSLEEAQMVAERIRKTCAESSMEPACTVSIGLTTRQNDVDTIDTMTARADAALYRAKSGGRNCIESG